MAKRRVNTLLDREDNLPDMESLSLLQKLTQENAPISPEDFAGAGNPIEYPPTNQMSPRGDVRQNEYLLNLRNLSKLTGSEDAIREEELEGAAGNEGGGLLDKLRSFLPNPAASSFSSMKQKTPVEKPDLESSSVSLPAVSLPTLANGKLQDPLEFLRMQIESNPSLMNDLPEETRQQLASTPANPNKEFLPPSSEAAEPFQKAPLQPAPEKTPIVPPQQEISTQMVEDFPDKQFNPDLLEKGIRDPQIREDLERLNGFAPVDEEVLRKASEWTRLKEQRLDELSQEERTLLQKAEEGTLSTLDKVALGVAIAIPILMTLRYGAEAGIEAATGGLEGFLEGKKGEQEKSQQLEQSKQKRLGEIQKERMALEEKGLDINKKALDQIQDKQVRKFLQHKKYDIFGKKVGIDAGDESGALWLDAKKFDASDEGVKKARKRIEDAENTIGIMRDSNKIVNEVLDILDALPQNVGVWDAIKKNYQWITGIGGHNPLGGQSPQVEILDENGNIRKIDALAELKQKITVLQDLYNKQVLGGTRLTGNVVNHWAGILGDPTKIGNWFSQDLNSFKQTTQSLKDIMNGREVEDLVAKGFLREPLEEKFPSHKSQLISSQDNIVNEIRQNPQAFKNKVK